MELDLKLKLGRMIGVNGCLSSNNSHTEDDESLSSSDTLSAKLVLEYRKRRDTSSAFIQKMEIWKSLYLSLPSDEKIPSKSRVNLMAFGSTMTRLGSSGADLDIVLMVEGPLDHSASLLLLERLMKAWSRREAMEVIPATVPLLRFKSKGIQVDLSAVGHGGRRHEGVRNTHLLMCYAELDPRVRPLAVIVKSWAKHHDLLGTYNKRLSGYGLILMLIFYLQQLKVLPCLQQEHVVEFNKWVCVMDHLEYKFQAHQNILEQYKRKPRQNNESLCELLHGFFCYYRSFPFSAGHVVSVRTGQILSSSECARDSAEHGVDIRGWTSEILIEEPFMRYNVARATSNRATARRILQTFATTAAKLKDQGTVGSIYYQ